MGLTVLWIIVAIVAIVVDLCTSTFLFVWISIGALAAMVANMFGLDLQKQVIIFSVISIISISIGYPWAKKKFKKSVKRTPLMEETYIGKEFVAEEDITNTASIKVGGIYWTAENKGKNILKGKKFKIIGIEGNKLEIELMEE